MKRIVFSVFFLTAVALHPAASGPEQSKVTPKVSSAPEVTIEKTAAALTPQFFIADKIVRLLKSKADSTAKTKAESTAKTGAQLMSEKTKTVPVGAKKSPATPKSKTPVKPGYVPPPPSPPSPEVNQIRQEVQKILDLNKTIKNIQGDRVLQLQRIQEQARIHQKILDQLEAGNNSKNAPKLSDKETLLAQEKLRIIHEETRRNQAVVSGDIAPESRSKDILPAMEDQAPEKT